MSDITAVGLGLMGGAFARALQRAGHELTVWNRSPQKMQPFIDAGATGAPDLGAAIGDSPLTLICVDNYSVTRSLLSADDVAPLLSRRTIIQLSTGTPLEARESADWMSERGAAYLDGAILGGPQSVDAGNAHILFAGPEPTFQQAEPLIACLGSNVRYLGENIGAAAALDLAWLCQRYGLFLGVIHGAYLCESEDVDINLYPTMFPDDARSRSIAEIIASDNYENPSATLAVWEGALKRIQQQAKHVGINREIPDFVSSFFERAIAAGHGEEDVAALVKVLRSAQ